MPRNSCSSPPWLASAFVLVVMATPAVSRAQTCASNADCMAGLTCQVSAVPPQPPVDPTCVKGQTCTGAATDATASIPVPVQTNTTCQVAPCKVDGDCAAGMVCHDEKSVSCSGGGPTCPPNTMCRIADAPPPPDTCVETTVSTCAFKWQLPCNTDQDCGSDFVCAPAVSGTCSSGSGVATVGGTISGGTGTATPVGSDAVAGAPTAVAPDSDGGTHVSSDGGTSCTTVTSFPGYCQPKSISCVIDADCPTFWTCVAPPLPLTGAAPPIAVDGTGPPPATVIAVPVSPKLCQPPVQYPVRGAGGIGIATDAGKVGTGSGSGGGTQPPTVGTKGGSENASGASNSGCTVAGPAGSAELSLLGLLAVGLLTLRRRTARRNH